MKKSIFILIVLTLICFNAFSQNSTEVKALKAALSNYIEAGDKNNIKILEPVLHEQFRVSLYDSKKDKVSILDRKTYISFIDTKKFGGYPRTPEFHDTIFIGENMCTLKVILKSPGKPTLKNFYSMVKLNGKWLVLQDYVTLVK